MSLRKLKIHAVRNLQQVNLEGLRRVNYFYGENGAGKTSILEAIHMLGMGRTFRRGSISNFIQHQRESAIVFGKLSSGSSSRVFDMGIKRDRDGSVEMRVGGVPVRTLSELVVNLPLQVINSDALELLTGSPGVRRRFLDWGVFHVEHHFYPQWHRYQKSIRQRNRLLRNGRPSLKELSVWDKELVSSGEALTTMRKEYVDALKPAFQYIIGKLSPDLAGLAINYRQGWDARLSYKEALESGLDTDLDRRFTHYGPHRADLRMTVDGYPAAEVLSRGQQKIMVYGMKLAQGRLLNQRKGIDCTYLIDDLPSELDEIHGRKVCGILHEIGAQVMITCISKDSLAWWPETGNIDDELAVFHVEHGDVKTENRAP